MANIFILIKFFFFLSLINSYLSDICSNIRENDYKNIELNTPLKFETKKGNEVCLKYEFKNDKKRSIGITFLKSNSYTIEVLVYDSYDKIKSDNGNYKSKKDSYIIGKTDFKEINVSNFNTKVYLIIKETKDYYYSDYIKLFDSEIPLSLKENYPLTIKNFMSNKEYNFVFSSEKNVVISYSSKSKGHKKITISRNNNPILEKIDSNDIIIPFEYDGLKSEYNINIKIRSDHDINYNQQFSIIYHENQKKFKEIKSSQKYKINYLISNNNQGQIFHFYVKIEKDFNKIYTINFKLDYSNKIHKYIEITTKKDSKLPDLNYNFNNNVLTSSYDRDSDENLKYYFIPEHSTFILIKVEIKKVDNYRAPNYFNISYSGPVNDINISKTPSKIFNQTFSPFYVNFYADNSKKYLFYTPYEDYCLLLKGRIFDNKAINKDYIDETSDLHEIGKDYNNFTAIILTETKKVNFIFKEYDPKNTLILNRKGRIKEPFNQIYTKENCTGNKKYIILKYDIEYYSIGQNNISNYWTTDGNMDVYYKNSLESNDFFPKDSSENKLEKEILYDSRTHLDLFTIKCNKPGIFYIRPLKKEFKDTTHDIYTNNIKKFEIFLGTEIIQLYSPIKDAPPHIYFTLITYSDNEIKISPDTSGLFKETSINNTTKLFNIEIDTKLYKMDQNLQLN